MVIRKLVYSLAAIGPLRRCVKALRLHHLANAWLRRFPIVKELPGGGVIYRATRLESLGLAVEMFDECNLYSADIVPSQLESSMRTATWGPRSFGMSKAGDPIKRIYGGHD